MDFEDKQTEDEQTRVSAAARTMVTPTIELLRPLGRGGMGHVWVARHHGLRTDVVVKFIAEHLASDPEAAARFSREAAAASQVKSPHVVQVFDHGVSTDGRLYIAMELLEGSDLATVLTQRGRVQIPDAVAIMSQVGRALAKAHERGIVHRDVKPDNIFLVDAGGGELFVKMLDFGIAKTMFATLGRGTATGAMVGTPYYMAPEQVMGVRAIGPGVDLWALGVVAFEMLTATLPFNGETVGAISVAICSGEMPKPTDRNAALPAAIDSWFLRACARDPAGRFATATEMADAFKTALADARATQPLPSPASRPRQATTNGGIAGGSTARPAARVPRWLVPAGVAALGLAGALVGVVAFTVTRPTPIEPDPPRPRAVSQEKPDVAPIKPEPEAKQLPDPEPIQSPTSAPSTKPSSGGAPHMVATPKPKLPPTAPTVAPAPPSASVSAAPAAPPPKKKKNVVIE